MREMKKKENVRKLCKENKNYPQNNETFLKTFLKFFIIQIK